MELNPILFTCHFLILNIFEHPIFRLKNTLFNYRWFFSLFKQLLKFFLFSLHFILKIFSDLLILNYKLGKNLLFFNPIWTSNLGCVRVSLFNSFLKVLNLCLKFFDVCFLRLDKSFHYFFSFSRLQIRCLVKAYILIDYVKWTYFMEKLQLPPSQTNLHSRLTIELSLHSSSLQDW